MNYLTVDNILSIHEQVLNKTGGLNGIKDLGRIESIVHFIQLDYYPSLIDKLTYIINGIAKFHVFLDANKRTAIASGAYFLIINAYDMNVINRFINEMKDLILLFVSNEINCEELQQFLSFILEDKPYSKELEYKKINLLNRYHRLYN